MLDKIRKLRDKGYFNKWVARAFIISLFCWFMFLLYLNNWTSGGGYYTCPQDVFGGKCVLKFYDEGCSEEIPFCVPKETVTLFPGQYYGIKPHWLTSYDLLGVITLFVVFLGINEIVWRIKNKW